jgi:hypothetical protein
MGEMWSDNKGEIGFGAPSLRILIGCWLTCGFLYGLHVMGILP